MEQKEFIRRILENGQGKLSHEDFSAIEDWKAISDENRAFAESIERTIELSSSYGQNIDFDPSDAYISFQERIKEIEVIPLKSTSSGSNFLKIAASLAILFTIVSGLWFAKGITSTQMATVYSEEGQTLNLSDKTKVVLNSKTSLEHFTALDANKRKIHLEGEAFFDVYRMPDKPFLITTNSIQIEVLGTSFNVRDLDKEDESIVYVKSGKVKISALAAPNRKVVLTAGQQVIFDKKTGQIVKSNDASINALSWMEGKLSFKKTKLKYAVKDLERYFDIKIDLKNKDLFECEYTSLFNKPQKLEIIETIAATFNLQLKQIGETNYELSGGSCE